jgi:hypothetical protein
MMETRAPKRMNTPMKIMAFTKPGMRSNVDSQEGPLEVVQVESGMVLAVPLLFRGRTIALALLIVNRTMNNIWKRMSMSFEKSVD